jgi:AcrR family transcriptional regulator
MKDAIHAQLTAARRDHILDGAAKVFAAKGYHSATIRDVAREVGVADGTIYNYFENKPALLLGVFDRMRAAVQPDPGALGPDGAGQADLSDLRGVLTAYFRYPLLALRGDNFALFRVVVSEMMVNPELRALYFERILAPALAGGEAMLSAWAARAAVRPVDVGLAVRAVSGVILGLIIENIMGDADLQARWDALPDFLADLFMNGLSKTENTSTGDEK